MAEDTKAESMYSRSEIILAYVWICIGALISVMIELVYVGARIDIGGRYIPIPFMIIIAWLFNGVLSRTALLWTKNLLVVSIPLVVWILGYLALTFIPSGMGAILVGSTLWSILLLLAGMGGGYWPIMQAMYQKNISPTPRTPAADHNVR